MENTSHFYVLLIETEAGGGGIVSAHSYLKGLSVITCNIMVKTWISFLLSCFIFLLTVLGFNDTSTLVGHFVSSPREREKRDRRDIRHDREGQRRKRKMNEIKETEEIKTLPLYPNLLQR